MGMPVKKELSVHEFKDTQLSKSWYHHTMAPSVLDKVMAVIKEQNTPGGSSRPALSKGLKVKYGEISAAAVKTAIKKGVDSGQ